jgi:hypothetical protein
MATAIFDNHTSSGFPDSFEKFQNLVITVKELFGNANKLVEIIWYNH